ncbi:MAG: type II toxin-antitoxin system HicB family antitoxin [Candidatus Electrothrix sp. YB6]
MKDMMRYKGYLDSVHYSDDDQVFYGKLEQNLIPYEETDVAGLRQAFEEAIDDYLALCTEEQSCNVCTGIRFKPEQGCNRGAGTVSFHTFSIQRL